jgi:hypothetical protein
MKFIQGFQYVAVYANGSGVRRGPIGVRAIFGIAIGRFDIGPLGVKQLIAFGARD